MGVAYTHWKKFRKALEAFERAIEINPNYADAHNNKGNTFKEKGEYDLAIKSYGRALYLNPEYIDAITNLGIIYDITNDFSKAELYFKQALALNPGNTSVLYNFANCLFNVKNYKQSISVCEKILELDASFYFAYSRIGLCYIQLENMKKAQEYFEKQ